METVLGLEPLQEESVKGSGRRTRRGDTAIETKAEHPVDLPVDPPVDAPTEVPVEMRVGAVLDMSAHATGEVPFEVPDRTRAEAPVGPDILAVRVVGLAEALVDSSVAEPVGTLAETTRWDVRSRAGSFDEAHHLQKGGEQVLAPQQRVLGGQVEMVGVGGQFVEEPRHWHGSTRFEDRQFLLSTPHTIDLGRRRGMGQKLRQSGQGC
jgi:hypothetical protein